jgi:ABC-type branched-subunit amino acid transport system substrate-binding protein
LNEQAICIGGLGPLTLPGLTWAGRDLLGGMTLAVEQINSVGGALGRPLALVFEDTQGRPQAGLAAVDKLLAQGIHAFAGEFHSVVADAIVEPIERSHVPFVCASATMDSITARRFSAVFRLAPPQSYGWAVYADWLSSRRFQHVVALQEDNIYWNSGSRVIAARLELSGIPFTHLPWTAGLTDVATCIGEVRRMRPAPDMLLMLVAYPEPFAALASEAEKHGLVPPGCFLGDPAGRVAQHGACDLPASAALQVPFLSYSPSRPKEEGQRMARKFNQRFGREPTFVACEGYDSVLVLAQAFVNAGSIEPAAVCGALRKLAVSGTRGTIQFSTEPDGVVHQQWKWPPVRVVAYTRPEQTLTDADVLWDSQHHSGDMT